MPPAPTVDTPGTNQRIMAHRLAPINALLGGTEVMRDAGEDFLPRYDQETQRVYDNRLARAVLFPYFERATAALAGRPFREPVKVTDDSPALTPLLQDVDMLGRNVTSFAHNTFQVAVEKGYSAVLVDFPTTPEALTLQEERERGARPYLKLLRPEDFVAGFAVIQNGREIPVHIRFHENETVREGFGEVLKERIRVLDHDLETGIVSWQLWEKQQRTRRHKPTWILVGGGDTTLNEIPLVVFYAGERQDFLLAEPPLLGLAHLNIQHWQSYSDQIHVLTVARFPILAASGVDDDTKLDVGPNLWLQSAAEGSKFYYVEHTGAAIGAGRQDLQDLETRMAASGIDLMVRRSGDRATATARAIDEAQGGSILQSMALDFQDPLTRALRLMERWLQVPDPKVTAEVNADFGLALKDQADLQFLLQLRGIGDLARVSILKEAKRRNILPEVFNEEENDAALEAEGPRLALPPPPSTPPDEDDGDDG